jgi:hypothetical protein
MKGVLSWLVRWACRAGTRDFYSALAALVGPVQNILSLAVNFFNSSVPIALQARQSAVLGRLSLGLFLWAIHVKRLYYNNDQQTQIRPSEPQ